jgi:hypothetical protein
MISEENEEPLVDSIMETIEQGDDVEAKISYPDSLFAVIDLLRDHARASLARIPRARGCANRAFLRRK